MHVLPEVSQSIEPVEHLVHFYDADPAAWAKAVGRYFAEGLELGEAGLVVTTPERRRAITRQLNFLGCDTGAAESSNRLIFRDAAEMLAQFTLDGEPDWDEFRRTAAQEMDGLDPISASRGIRVYGDMVGILWSAHQFSDAMRLEDFWNRLQRSASFRLFCGYPINIFTGDFTHSQVDAVLGAHTRMVPTGEDGDLHQAVTRAIYEVAGPDACELEDLIQPAGRHSVQLPPPEAAILGLRRKLPEQAQEIIEVARLYYQSERRFRALIKSSVEAILLFDSDANITYCSASTTQVLGHQPLDLAGRSAFGLVHPDDLGEVQEAFEEALENPACAITLCARLLSKDQQWRFVRCSFTNHIDDPDIRAVVVNYSGITEQQAIKESALRSA